MVFNSLTYAVFLVVVLTLYYPSRLRVQNIILLIASYVFYGWWDVRFLFLVTLSTAIDYWSGLVIHRGRLEVRERLIPVLYLSFFGLFCLSVDYSHSASGFTAQFNWESFTYVVVGLTGFFSVSHLLYRYSLTLKEDARRRRFLVASIVQNLSILGFFKYFNFFAESLAASLAALGFNVSPTTLNIILPIGVSFYTFQSISYAVEVYQGKVVPSRKFSDFALFVAYFPQLVAGPINRATALLPQLIAERKVSVEQISSGVFLILLGLFKKIGIADGVSRSVDQVFNGSGQASWLDIMAGTLLFAVQIYCDFSGYTDIARGSSRLLGIELTINFRNPYFSSNPQEFWRRWHISLSQWLRDYLYVPLGGNRGGNARVYANLMLTMLLGGLWHGAAWNFVAWGAYQGFLLSAYRAWSTAMNTDRKKEQDAGSRSLGQRARHIVAIGGFFCLVCYGWLLFRANSLEQIVQFTSTLLFDVGDMRLNISLPRLASLLGIALLGLIEVAQYATNNEYVHRRLPLPVRGLLFALLISIIIMGLSNEPAQFIYFQF